MSHQPRILIVGVGSIGERHLRCFQATGRCSVALCELMDDRRQQVADRYGVTGYRGWEEAVASEEFSAAVIASPAPWHVSTAQALTDRGLDLLIEKPLGLNLDGIDQLAESVKQRGNHVGVGFTYRAFPALKRMRDAVRSGEFGRIVQIQVQSGQHFPLYRPAYREIYYSDPAQGGGLIQDMLPHFLNAVEWIAGAATKVVVDASHKVLEGVEVEDTVNLITRHDDIMASFSLNQHQCINETEITVLCQQGAARWELKDERWMSATENGGDWNQRDSFVCERDDYYMLQANAFLDGLNGVAEPLCPLADGIDTLKSTLAILKSRETGNWESVNE